MPLRGDASFNDGAMDKLDAPLDRRRDVKPANIGLALLAGGDVDSADVFSDILRRLVGV